MPQNSDRINKMVNCLLQGNREECSRIIDELFKRGLQIFEVYENVLKKALYAIGKLWEYNKISVATEHLASAIVESVMSELYYKYILEPKNNRVALVACIENETHQIGLKMVNDVFEKNSWNSHFLGANTPTNELLKYISIIKPEILALSTSIYFHLPNLEQLLLKVQNKFSDMPVLIGGQAFLHGGNNITEKYKGVTYIKDLEELSVFINKI